VSPRRAYVYLLFSPDVLLPKQSWSRAGQPKPQSKKPISLNEAGDNGAHHPNGYTPFHFALAFKKIHTIDTSRGYPQHSVTVELKELFISSTSLNVPNTSSKVTAEIEPL
jgi:hypothetical protein